MQPSTVAFTQPAVADTDLVEFWALEVAQPIEISVDQEHSKSRLQSTAISPITHDGDQQSLQMLDDGDSQALGLTASEVRALAALLGEANENGECTISYRALGLKAGMCESTAYRAVVGLASADVIVVKRLPYRRNRYSVCDVSLRTRTQRPGGRQGRQRHVAEISLLDRDRVSNHQDGRGADE